MALLELAMVTGAIVEMGVDAAWEKAKRQEAIVRLLARFGLDPKDPPADFDGVYAYTIIEYGMLKSEAVLNFFRHKFVREAFQKAFAQGDSSILDQEAELLVDWNNATNELGEIDFDPRKEFAAFSAVFNELVDRTRTPVEVKQDQKLVGIQQTTTQIVERLNELDTLEEIRTELREMNQERQARKFVFAPSESKLKVFISSKMLELRDLREMLDKYLEERGLDAWIYEDDGGARPDTVVETSLREVEVADIYVGLFWQKYGEVTVEEYRHARNLKKPCFVYIRDQNIQRESLLEDFLQAEVYDPKQGVTYDYFDKAQPLVQQVADDIMSWLMRRHREMTAQIQAASVSADEVEQLKAEVSRLQAISRDILPQGTPNDLLAQQMRGWFQTLGYAFESHNVRTDDHFEWIVNVPTRRSFDRIYVYGVAGEGELGSLKLLQQAVDKHKADEGWLVATRRISQAARDEVEKRENRDLFCYTFDELLDEHADFTGYLEWLESEIRRRGIDQKYIALAAKKDELDLDSGQKIGESRYDERNGWIDGYIDRWLADPSKEHISILGEFGTGKTWFTLHYAWTSLKRYQEAKERGTERPRLPLVIPLRDYAKAVSLESLFSEFFFRKHEIPIPGYTAFEQLNRMGKLLLIFDGFDEMAARIDRQKMINNFWELARAVVPGSKAILTCRTEHFPTAQEGRALLGAELRASTARLSGEPPQFEVLELEKFDDDQIRQALLFRTTPDVVEQILENRELLDLVRRPVMTELVIEALPDIEMGKPIDLSRVYLYAVRRKMERDVKSERTFTSLADKLYFMCELSWEMISNDKMSLNYRDFPHRLHSLFPHAVQEQKQLDHWHYDMMAQTMLVRNAEGDYSPAHRSLLEFFVAYKFVSELGVLASDFLDLAKQQTKIDESSPSRDYKWSEYFKRSVDARGEVETINPIQKFVSEDFSQLIKTWGVFSISRAILDLSIGMVAKSDLALEKLISLLKMTHDLNDEYVGFTGGNIATLLVKLDPMVLSYQDLLGVNLRGANLVGACLIETNLQKSNLKDIVLDSFYGWYHHFQKETICFYYPESYGRVLSNHRIRLPFEVPLGEIVIARLGETSLIWTYQLKTHFIVDAKIEEGVIEILTLDGKSIFLDVETGEKIVDDRMPSLLSWYNANLLGVKDLHDQKAYFLKLLGASNVPSTIYNPLEDEEIVPIEAQIEVIS